MNDAASSPEPTGAPDRAAPSDAAGHLAAANGAGARPSPYDALRPSSRGPEAAGDRSPPRRTLAARLISDAPVKVMAVLVAVLLWNAVRDRIVVDDEVPVGVRLVPPDPSVRVEKGNDRGQVVVGLRGTRAEVERVKGDLTQLGEPARFLFSVPAGVNSGRVGPVSKGGQLQFPVKGAPNVVRDLRREIEATWHRIVEVKLKVAAPTVLTSAKFANVEYETPQMADAEVTVSGPANLFVSGFPLEIRPDAVDLAAWLETDPDLYTPYQFETRFDEWRRSGPLRGTDLVEIRPERVKGTLMLKPRKSERVANRVRELWESADLAREWELTIRASTSFDPATRLLTAELRGDPRVLEALRKSTPDWAYAIAVPPPPKPGEPPKEAEDADVFLWFRTSPGPAVRLATKTTVFVSLKKRGA